MSTSNHDQTPAEHSRTSASKTIKHWQRLAGDTSVRGQYKERPEYFEVIEELGFLPTVDEKGQHHWLHVRKTQLTTEQVAKFIAQAVGVPVREVGYSGLKDKFAVTEQWFSVQLPALTQPDWTAIFAVELTSISPRYAGGQVTLLNTVRSSKKLRRGVHKANHFRLRLTSVSDPAALQARFSAISNWIPNYYGEQRFGFGQGNIQQAEAMFAGKRIKDRNLRSILLSSVRSWLFNHYLERRIETVQTKLLAGDVFLLAGSHSFFTATDCNEEIQQRVASGDIIPSGPLFGDGESAAQAEALALEVEVASMFPELHAGLVASRVKPDRRELWLRLQDAHYQQISDSEVEVRFSLPAGSFATSVLQELGEFSAPRYE